MNIVKFEGQASPQIEPAPDVVVELELNGHRRVVTVKAGRQPTDVQFGNFTAKVAVKSVRRQVPRPATGPPYNWRIRAEGGLVVIIRSIDEENARRLFAQRHDAKIISVALILE